MAGLGPHSEVTGTGRHGEKEQSWGPAFMEEKGGVQGVSQVYSTCEFKT